MNTAPVVCPVSPQAHSPALSDEMICARVAEMRQQMLTVCAWTHRIKYAGEWMTPDLFLWRCFQIRVTHGITPAALEQALEAGDETTRSPCGDAKHAS